MPLSDAEITWIGFVAERDLAGEWPPPNSARRRKASSRTAECQPDSDIQRIDLAMGLVIETRRIPAR